MLSSGARVHVPGPNRVKASVRVRGVGWHCSKYFLTSVHNLFLVSERDIFSVDVRNFTLSPEVVCLGGMVIGEDPDGSMQSIYYLRTVVQVVGLTFCR